MQQHSLAAQLLQQMQDLLSPNTAEVRLLQPSGASLYAADMHMPGSPHVSRSSALCYAGVHPSVICCCLLSLQQT
jgi:hypothetical protein